MLEGPAAGRLAGSGNGDLLSVPGEWRRTRAVAEFAAAELRFDAGASRGLPMRLDPYQVHILDGFGVPGVTSVRLLAGAQGGKTTCLLAVIGHGIAEEPAEMMVVQPTERPSAEKFTRQRVDPMIAASEVLAERVAGKRTPGRGNNVSMKVFPGGFLSIAGASAPAGLASMPAGILLADEIDKWPLVVGARGAKEKGMLEGDPLMLARRRQHGYAGTAREMLASTPTTVEGRIWESWREGDRCVWVVPCPHCEHEAAMTWGDHKLQPGHGPAAHVVRWHDGRGAAMTCGKCERPWSRLERIAAARAGRWRATAAASKPGARSYYIWRAMSSWGKGLDDAWEERIAADEKAAAGEPVAVREWRQGVLGVPSWNDAEDFPAVIDLRRELLARVIETRERVEAGDPWPPPGLVRTVGVDVQMECVHAAVVGWRRGGTGYLLARETFEGDPSDVQDSAWVEAEGWIRGWSPRAINVDSGYLPDVVAEVVMRWGERVAAMIKGVEKGAFVRQPELPEAVHGSVDGYARARGPAHVRRKLLLWTIGTVAGKRILMRRLARRAGGGLAIHVGPWMTEDDVAELVSEHEIVQVNERTGRRRKVWKQVQPANHLLDMALYALHAFRRLRSGSRAEASA